jgi:hypothetical protein
MTSDPTARGTLRSRSTTRRHLPAAIAVLVATIAVAGCAEYGSRPPAPAPPPPPRALTVYAANGQTKAQQDRDTSACQSAASAQATSSAEWAHLFGACMAGRGYRVE